MTINIEYETDPDSRTRMKFILERDQLYQLYSTSPNEEAVITAALRDSWVRASSAKSVRNISGTPS